MTTPDPHATLTPTVGETSSTGTRFRILRPHAKGGLGEVFVAADEELHREVALKQMQDRAAHDPSSRARFLLEAEITGGLEHPGIVPVYGLGTYADGRPFYAMRFIRGDSLMEAIERFHSQPRTLAFDSIDFRKLLTSFIDVCNAIQYAHDRGVLHRDLKPGNIMLGPYGETLVVDWGLAKSVGRQNAESSTRACEPGTSAGETLPEPLLIPQSGSGVAETQAGSAIGTPPYMSPEQAAGRIDLLGPASDVYSLGATLYCLLTGVAPLDDNDLGTVLRKAERGEFPSPRQRNPHIPPALEAVCLKAMSRRPGDRYVSPRHLAEDIERWLADDPVRAWPEPWRVKARRWIGSHRTLVTSSAAAIFVTLIAGTLGSIWYHREQARLGTELALRIDVVQDALDHARKSRGDLHAILAKPGGATELLNQPDRWEAYLSMAESALAPAVVLLRSSADVPPEMVREVRVLEASLVRDAADKTLAFRLEKIRLSRVLATDASEHAKAMLKYEETFQSAGFRFSGTPAELQRSPIKAQLAAAFDDWALASRQAGKNEAIPRLLEWARAADADPHLGDRIRQPELWNDAAGLTRIAREVNPHQCTPRTVRLLGRLLRLHDGDVASWFLRAHDAYPTDFWINLELGCALEENAERIGYYRAAVGIRPTSSVAWTALAAALREQGNLVAAKAADKKAREANTK